MTDYNIPKQIDAWPKGITAKGKAAMDRGKKDA